MKKLIIAVLCIAALTLCACGEAQSAPTPSPAPVVETPAPETPAPTETPPAQEPENALMAAAEALVGQSVAELYEAIGEPESSEYAPSCMGDGEDGNLYYDGFVVYTYKEGASEEVYAVR